MVEYRAFRNADPPAIHALWRAAGLGRGAAVETGVDAFDLVNYSQPFFDRDGLLVAIDRSQPPASPRHEGRLVGFVHAGFAACDDASQLDRSQGVICAIVVDPAYRRRGIGRELLTRAEQYLRSGGATRLVAGPARHRDPFFYGLYGGSRPSGFLESDPAAAPFLAACGYQPFERHGVFQRDLQGTRDPANFRIVSIRRKSELEIVETPPNPAWWWYTHTGRLDSVSFRLVPRTGGDALAQLTAVGLDLYLNTWQERVVGLSDLRVRDDLQGKGYGQTLIIEVLRRLRLELVTRVELHSPESARSVLAVIQATGFQRVDTGHVYERLG